MTRRRWIADELSGNRAALIGEHAGHLIRVLRARVGQEFDIATGSTVRRGRIVLVADGRVEFDLGEEVPAAAALNLTLALAIFKFDRMEWAIEKCTELGVARIVPVIARRTQPHLAAAATKRVERWRRIANQASEQSRRAASPEITAPVKLQEAIKMDATLRIVLSESAMQSQIREILNAHYEAHPKVDLILAIGPEGGWADEELREFEDAGWFAASLGPTILRAETAAIAATAMAL